MIKIHRFPDILETYYLEEAASIPTSTWGRITGGEGYLGAGIKRLSGPGIMAGWALPVTCPKDNPMATYVALQTMMDSPLSGRWVMVVVPESGDIEGSPVAMWTYIQSAMGWEVGFVGALIDGFSKDTDEIRDKLGKEFSVFSKGGTAVPGKVVSDGVIGSPVVINGVQICTGDMIVGDTDGLICVPKDRVASVHEKCQVSIVDDANMMAQVREGVGAVDVIGVRDDLKGNVEVVE